MTAARPIPTEIPGVAQQQAALLWERHGEMLGRLSTAQVRTRVMDWLELLGARDREAENVLALIEQKLRDEARPADSTPGRRERLFTHTEDDDVG